MIVTEMSLWPGGIKEKARPLGTIVIAKHPSSTAEHRNYDVALTHAGIYIDKPGAWKGGFVTGYNPVMSPYHLLQMALAVSLRGKSNQRAVDLITHMRNGGTLPLMDQVIKDLQKHNGNGGGQG